MSFSSDIKDKLCILEYTCEICSVAELTGFSDFSGATIQGNLKIITENENVSLRFCEVLKNVFGRAFEIIHNGRGYIIEDTDTKISEALLQCSADILTSKECCRASYVRGAFLCGGSVNSPEKSYHMEFLAGSKEAAQTLKKVLESFNVASKITKRKGRYVVYIKEADTIADTLTLIGDSSGAIEMYNVQITKDLRNRINRQVNCETANTVKTIGAASRHKNAINKIKSADAMGKLPDVLIEMVNLRLEYPEASLAELGQYANPPIGKSGVNHRLERIVKFAADLDEKE